MNKNLFGNTCVCLARVSTSAQDYQAQINALRKRAKEFGLKVIKEIATKESGFLSYDKKEGFNELTKVLSETGCKIVLCTELSRLSRRQFLLEYIKQWFIDNKIQLWVDDIEFLLFKDSMEVDVSTNIIFSVFAAMAESEMKDKKKRTKRGLVDLNKAGFCLTGRVTYGYERVRTDYRIKGKIRTRLKVNDKAADEIRSVYDWYLNGIDGDFSRCSMRQIREECVARGFGSYLHSKRNINKCLKNELYTGHTITHNKRKNPDFWTLGDKNAPKYIATSTEITTETIIPRETFDAVQSKMKGANSRMVPVSSSTNTYADKSRTHVTLLSKLITCPRCKNFYMGEYDHRRGQENYFYRCLNHKSHGAFTISMKFLDFIVWEFCKAQYDIFIEYFKKYSTYTDTDDVQKRIENIQKKKKEYEDMLEKLVIRYLSVQSIAKSDYSDKRFEKESKKIKDEIGNCDAMIRKEKTSITEKMRVKVMAANRLKALSTIESNKAEMKKYVAYVIRTIVPIYQDMDYIVVQVFLMNEKILYYTYYEPDHRDHEFLFRNYLIINKRDIQSPKFRYISCPCEFDIDTQTFKLPNSNMATLDDAMADVDELYFKEVHYNPLQIYDKDKSRQMGNP